MEIGRKDIIWNYAATFLRIAASILLYPLILRMMSPAKVGIWTIFAATTSFSVLLDFGFNESFTRNITYIFSGVRTLQAKGFSKIGYDRGSVDYGLLKGTIDAMRWFYLRVAVILFALLITFGTYYIHILLKNYTEGHLEIYIAWILLCLINTYQLYTLYYDSLMQGKGLIKRSKQIIIIGQSVYLIVASVMILAKFGLIAIVSAQAFSVVIVRTLSYHSFFTKELKQALHSSIARTSKEILAAIYPNALKLGLTLLGGFLVTRSAIVLGSLYLTLEEIATYGITIQVITIIVSLSGIYTATFLPKIAQLRIDHNSQEIKELYLKGQFVLVSTFFIGGIFLIFFGEPALRLIGSQTHLMPQLLIFGAILIYFLETNHSIAGTIIISRNDVPFLKASLLSGLSTVILLLIFFNFTKMGLWAMIAAPGISQGVYQNWKWPLEVAKEFKITLKDTKRIMNSLIIKFFNIFKLRGNFDLTSPE